MPDPVLDGPGYVRADDRLGGGQSAPWADGAVCRMIRKIVEADAKNRRASEPVAFEIQGRNLVIRNTDGRVQIQGVPKGLSPETFRHVLSAVDVYWNTMGYYPTPKQAHQYFPQVPLPTYGRVMASTEFGEALRSAESRLTGGSA